MKKIQSLPFSIVISREKAISERLLATRERAFNRHDDPIKNSEHFLNQLKADDGTLISAESKASGECLGSLRVESNFTNRFYFEHEVTTSDLEDRTPSLLASRLNVTKGHDGTLARLALCKALYLYSHANQARFVYCFVNESRFRLYRNLGFEAVFDGNPSLMLDCHNKIPTKLIRSEVNVQENVLTNLSLLVKDFIFNTYHPDIRIFDSVGNLRQIRRRNDFSISNADPMSRMLPVPVI
jgi:hypothetical protein